MSSSLSVDDVLKSMNDKGDQLIVVAALTKLPPDELAKVQGAWKRICKRDEELREKHERRTKVLQLVQEALSQLRLDMKYLVFDLEATRRERDNLREKYNDYDDAPGDSS